MDRVNKVRVVDVCLTETFQQVSTAFLDNPHDENRNRMEASMHALQYWRSLTRENQTMIANELFEGKPISQWLGYLHAENVRRQLPQQRRIPSPPGTPST